MTRITRLTLMLLLFGLAPVIMAAGGDSRAYTGGRFVLELDGETVGYVKSVDGGHIVGEVATQQLGPENLTKKHISNIKFTDITIEVDMGMSRSFYDWIQASFDRRPEPRSGAIIAVDVNNQEMSRREFMDALITEVAFPALDGSSKDPAYMTIKIQPTRIRYQKGSGKVIGKAGAYSQEKWLASNFRFEIDGLDTSNVSKIDGFAIKQRVAEDKVGRFREPQVQPSAVELPNLKVTMSMQGFDSWYGWFEDFLINGNSRDDNELSGSITFLAPDLTTELGRIDLEHVGIVKLAPADGNVLPQFTAELYVENMKLFVN